MFPAVSTHRLVLDQFTEADIPLLVKQAGNYNVAKSTLNIPHPYTIDDAIAWIQLCEKTFKERSVYSFAIRLKETLQLAGGVGLKINKRFNHAELGYWIAEPFWNKGFATEAAKAVTDFGFSALRLHKIFATHIPENPASGKVMQHIGMTKEGEMKDHVFKNGVYHTLIQYAIVSSL